MRVALETLINLNRIMEIKQSINVDKPSKGISDVSQEKLISPVLHLGACFLKGLGLKQLLTDLTVAQHHLFIFQNHNIRMFNNTLMSVFLNVRRRSQTGERFDFTRVVFQE